MRRKKCLLVSHGYTLNDPPARQAASSLCQSGWDVTIFQGAPHGTARSSTPDGVKVFQYPGPGFSPRIGPIYRVARWHVFRRTLRSWIRENSPDLVVTIMLHSLACLPYLPQSHRFRLVSCIYDIPSLTDAGYIDRFLIQEGWKRLKEADVIWSSDSYKVEWTRIMGELRSTPMVCHNCPSIDWIPTTACWPRDGWLRTELRKQNVNIGDTGGCVVVRAGAIGENGGIEETLCALRELPEDIIFLMMGRATDQYRNKLIKLINEMGFCRRAIFWDRPSDEIWKLALAGADVGHLIHGPFLPGPAIRMFELNSSLSNNRLFQYMAAGLPIVSYDDPRMDALYKEVPCFKVVKNSHLKEDMETAIRELWRSPEHRRTLGEAGYRAHRETYNWERQFQPVLSAIGGF